MCVYGQVRDGPARGDRNHGGSSSFEDCIKKALHDSAPCSVEHMQDTLIEVAVASGSVAHDKPLHGKPWDSDELRRLRALRRSSCTAAERRRLSQQIHSCTRSSLRRWQTERLRNQLESFAQLHKLPHILQSPVVRKHVQAPPAEAFADAMSRV